MVKLIIKFDEFFIYLFVFIVPFLFLMYVISKVICFKLWGKSRECVKLQLWYYGFILFAFSQNCILLPIRKLPYKLTLPPKVKVTLTKE